MSKKQKVIVVGGAGYIGGKTVDILIDAGLDVTVYDSLVYESRFLKPVNFIRGDIRNTEKLVQVSNGFDVIILMAALVGDPACSINDQLTNEINYESIKRFCERIDKSKHIIFMSTCSVYGAQDGNLTETSNVSPLSSYAVTKLKAEQCVRDCGGTIFRLGTVFGVGDTYSRLRMDLVVNVLTMKAYKYNKITINGGDQWRPIISVTDVGHYILCDCYKRSGDTFILSKENVTIKQLGERISSIIPNIEVEYVDTSFQDARNYRVDNSKALEAFSYRPCISVEHEVNHMLSLFRDGRICDPESLLYSNEPYLRSIM